jgi:hypothetical protein
MNDKRLYPNTVIFKGTDDNEITYINERVLDKIRAEIEHLLNRPSLTHVVGYDKGFVDGIDKALQIIDKYTKGEQE